MIRLMPIAELSVYGVEEAGVPNRERISLRPTETVNLGRYGVLLAIQNETGGLTPVPDHFFWFGERVISPPAWVILLTGKGENRVIEGDRGPLHIFFWGKEQTLFNIPNIAAAVFEIGAFNAVPILPSPSQVKEISSDR